VHPVRQSVHPPGRARVHFLGNRGDLDGRSGYFVVLACVLMATTKKWSSTFSGKKCTPKENRGYAYVCGIISV